MGPLWADSRPQDMHYAEFGEDEVRTRLAATKCHAVHCPIVTRPILTTPARQSAALLAAIREYDANKWKVIGQKVGKPAKVRVPILFIIFTNNKA